ncbi:MAG: response regulator [Nitrospirae bacterium]|nr:response regulator [Nitrospirota bacterium]
MLRKILISDDSQLFVISAGLLLKRMEFRVIPARNADEVLSLSKLSEPHLIIIGNTLKTMDWSPVVKHLKEDRQTAHIPIIMVSSDSDRGVMKRFLELGCSAYLFKPLRIDELHGAIQRSFYSRCGTDRKHLRVQFKTKVKVTLNGEVHELYSENLSVGGIYLRKKDPFPVGTRVGISLTLGAHNNLDTKGSVIYTKELFGDIFRVPPGMAVGFTGMTEEICETLRNFIEDMLADDILETQEEIMIVKDKDGKCL